MEISEREQQKASNYLSKNNCSVERRNKTPLNQNKKKEKARFLFRILLSLMAKIRHRPYPVNFKPDI
jgi:hypothetical protein